MDGTRILGLLACVVLSINPLTLSAASISPGDLIISEVMADPKAVSDTYGEWFEVHNLTGNSLDLNGLWDVSKVKDELCGRITSVRRQISAVVRAGHERRGSLYDEAIDAVPEADREGLRRLSGKVGTLKREVEAYRKENKAFVDESLAFIDDLIMNLSGGSQAQNVYDNRCRMRKTGNRMLLMREV